MPMKFCGYKTKAPHMERTTGASSEAWFIIEMQNLINDLQHRYETVNAHLLELQKRALLRQQFNQLHTRNADALSREPTNNLLLLTEIQHMQQSQLLLSERLALLKRSLLQLPSAGNPIPPQAPALASRVHGQGSPLSAGSIPLINSAPTQSISDTLKDSLSYAHQALPSPKRSKGFVPRNKSELMIGASPAPAKKRRAVALKNEEAEAIGSRQKTTPHKPRPPVPMAVASDQSNLSTLQVHIRESLEFFQNSGDDPSGSSMRCHKKVIQPFQVGIRCKYCAHIPLADRRKASVSYPKTLLAVYRAAQNIASTHLLDDAEEGCTFVPTAVRKELEIQRPQRDASNVGVSYWVETCRAVGIEEADGALWFSDDAETKEEPVIL